MNGVNNLGQVAGSYTPGTASHGFLLAVDGKTFTTFDVSGETSPSAVNDQGEIVVPALPPPRFVDGFLRRVDGSVTTIRVPNASATRPSGINNNGEIAGTFVVGGSGGIARGFLRKTDGSYITIEVRGIEGAQVTGLKHGPNHRQFRGHGFVRNADGT